ncbi:hypothetical protein ACFC00_42525 [Streptomyces adustus]|uniref:hypothetical protein n=1 Tax=Streptomyces adustus TaxID=1609272 RepID=UPI0035E23AAC
MTFVEPVAGLTERYRRRTPALRRVIEAIAKVLAGMAGARLLTVLHQEVSRASVLNCLMRIAPPKRETPYVVGIDEFAARPPLRHDRHRRTERSAHRGAAGPEGRNGLRLAAGASRRTGGQAAGCL